MLAVCSGQLTQLQQSLTLIQQSVSVSVVAFSFSLHYEFPFSLSTGSGDNGSQIIFRQFGLYLIPFNREEHGPR